jgi:3-oxoacyl-[acyl-carrier-protein] synthase III
MKRQWENIALLSSGYYIPEGKITSDEIESRLEGVYHKIGLKSGHLYALTGVKERRVGPRHFSPSLIATIAASKALAKLGIEGKDLGAVLYTGVCRDFLEPATAALIHKNLKMSEDAEAIDISQACSGFLAGLIQAAEMLSSRPTKPILVVTGENASQIYEDTLKGILEKETQESYFEQLASLTLGSAGVAFILARTGEDSSNPKLTASVSLMDSANSHLCVGKNTPTGLTMKTDGVGLLKHGLNLAKKGFREFQELTTISQWDHYLTHQVSKKHYLEFFRMMELDQKKGPCYLEYLGNTGSAAVPLGLCFLQEERKIHKDQNVCLLGIGSGLNIQMLGFKW